MKAFRVVVPREHEDWASAVLWESATEGIEVREAQDAAELLAYFPDETPLPDLEAALAAVPGATLEAAEVPEVDWVKRFREGFRGFSAGSFSIAPAWDVPAGDRTRVLIVDPGRAFGTGTHETTRLCLRAIEDLASEPRGLGRLLDVGMGTGILALAGRRLGAVLSVGVDLDAESVDSAARHRELNGDHFHLVRGDGAAAFVAGTFDSVVANISAPLLVRMRDELLRVVAPRGALVLSGLLVTDVAEVGSAYSGAGSLHERVDGEWAAVVVRRS